MRLHRFYISPEKTHLDHEVWIRDENLLRQWVKVLRYELGSQLILFDGVEHDRQYQITAVQKDSVHLSLVTDLVRKTPKRSIYLFWSLLKKDKNDWVLQKCTELGASHFVPLMSNRTEKTGFNLERAEKILIEAAEQCGRSDIPSARDPIYLDTAIKKYKEKIKLYVAEQSENTDEPQSLADKCGIFVGPEGGWSNEEKTLFKNNKVDLFVLHDFTLRAETACVSAVNRLVQ